MSDTPRGLHYGWLVLIVGTLVVFGSLGLARFGYSLVLPAMQEGLELGNTGAGGLATANLVGYLALALIGGALASRFGPRVVIAAGLAVAGASMLFTGLTTGFAGAAIWRAVTGVGSGASNVPVMGLLAAWFSVRRRGLATGIGVAGSSLALIALGPSVPRVLAAFGDDGWRVCWYLFGGVTLLLALLAAGVLRNRPAEVGLLPVGESVEEAARRPRWSGLHWGDVYRAPAVWHLGLVYVAFGFSYIIYMTFFAKALIAEGGYSPQAAGNLFMTMGWFSLLCGLIWGSVSDVIGRKGALVIVYLLQATAYGVEHPGDHGRRLRRPPRPAHGPRRAGLHHAVLRHRAGARPHGRRGDGRCLGLTAARDAAGGRSRLSRRHRLGPAAADRRPRRAGRTGLTRTATPRPSPTAA